MRQRDNGRATRPAYEQPGHIPMLFSPALSTGYLLFIPTCGSILSLFLSMPDSVRCGGARSTDGVPAGKDLKIKADRCSGSWEK